MLTDALCAADPYIQVEGSVTVSHPDGLYRMSESYSDMKALSNLNDQILEVIKYDRSGQPAIKLAKELIRRIEKRDLVRVCVI
jgi:hypothetical protein